MTNSSLLCAEATLCTMSCSICMSHCELRLFSVSRRSAVMCCFIMNKHLLSHCVQHVGRGDHVSLVALFIVSRTDFVTHEPLHYFPALP